MATELDPIRPSGFDRIMNCPGARRMQSKIPGGGTSSVYAKLGSAAHTLVADCLLNDTLPLEHFGRVITEEGEDFDVDLNMINATSIMTGHCRSLMKQAEWFTIEAKMPIPNLDMDKGGTGDFIAVVTDTLHVVDYKHGAGVYVNEVGNAQFLSYAWGAGHMIPEDLKPRIQKLALTCIQPRVNKGQSPPIRTWDIKTDDLYEWIKGAMEAVRISRREDAPLVPGDWCRFCDAKGICGAQAQLALQQIQGA